MSFPGRDYAAISGSMNDHKHVWESNMMSRGRYRCACGASAYRNITTGAIVQFKKGPVLEEPTITVFHREYFDMESKDDERAIGVTFYDVEPERAHARRVNARWALRMIFEL